MKRSFLGAKLVNSDGVRGRFIPGRMTVPGAASEQLADVIPFPSGDSVADVIPLFPTAPPSAQRDRRYDGLSDILPYGHTRSFVRVTNAH